MSKIAPIVAIAIFFGIGLLHSLGCSLWVTTAIAAGPLRPLE
jgi:hypothetical protein